MTPDESIFVTIAKLHESLGLPPLGEMPGRMWIHKVDDHYTLAINAGDIMLRKIQPEGTMGADIPPFTCAVWFNGWLAGLFTPYDGTFAAGSAANLDTFREALRKAARLPN